jgi:hypothetical protein
MRKLFGLALSFAALALTTGSPAHAQFAPNFPMIIVPPPAQNIIVQRPTPTTTQMDRQYPAPVPPPEVHRCHYQGQTKFCD